MTYCPEKNKADSFSVMKKHSRSIFLGYALGTVIVASATLPKSDLLVKPEMSYTSTCSVSSHSELSIFLAQHAEMSFKSIWEDPAEDIWDTL